MSGGIVVHCLEAAYDRYVGRGDDPRTGTPCEWGNPWSHRPSRLSGVVVVASLEEAICRHKRWLWKRLRTGRLPMAQMAELEGETLGCWCRQPGSCHGHTLHRAARWAAGRLHD